MRQFFSGNVCCGIDNYTKVCSIHLHYHHSCRYAVLRTTRNTKWALGAMKACSK